MSRRLDVLQSLVSRFILLLFFAVPLSAHAVENGVVEYPIGVNTVNPAFLPPPNGTLFLDYLEGYTSNRFNGGHGESLIPGFHVNVVAEVVRALHTWNVSWHGLNFTSGLVQPLLYQSLHLPGISQRSFEAGDTVLQPLYVTGAIGDFHFLFGSDVWVPDGQYNVHDVTNAGLNYWTFGLEQAFTWLPTKSLEVSAEFITAFRTKNNATHYKSGNDFTMDWVIGYRPLQNLPSLQLGVQGYVYSQWTDDSVNGQPVNGGNRGQAFAVGPQIRYDIGHSAIIAKWQHEFEVRNRPTGERFWVQFALPL